MMGKVKKKETKFEWARRRYEIGENFGSAKELNDRKLYAHLLVRTTMNRKLDFSHTARTKRLAERIAP